MLFAAADSHVGWNEVVTNARRPDLPRCCQAIVCNPVRSHLPPHLCRQGLCLHGLSQNRHRQPCAWISLFFLGDACGGCLSQDQEEGVEDGLPTSGDIPGCFTGFRPGLWWRQGSLALPHVPVEVSSSWPVTGLNWFLTFLQHTGLSSHPGRASAFMLKETAEANAQPPGFHAEIEHCLRIVLPNSCKRAQTARECNKTAWKSWGRQQQGEYQR